MATYTVTNLDDSGNGSLRQAISDANATGGSDTITFASDLAGGTLTLTQGELDVASNVTIDGDVNGDGKADITIDANSASRVIDVASGDVNLDSLTLTGGYSTQGGAGVYVAAGATATILDSTISGNVTNGSSNARGGGIRNAGTTTLVNSTVSGNYGTNAGGIFNPGGTLSLINTTVADNTSDVYVGGIYSFNGHLNIADSTITGNFGGPSRGGGIFSFNDQGTLSNSIVAGNQSYSGVADLYSGGFSQQLAFAGVNVFSQSGVGGANDIHQADLSKIFADVTTVDPDSTPSHDFQAGALADNGGPVQTVAISPTGVAFNAGNSAVLPPDPNNPAEPLQVDARGEPRVFDGGLDVGAVEVQGGHTWVVTTLNDELTSTDPNATLADFGGAGDLSLREALVLASRDTGDTITFASDLAGGTLTLTQGELDIASNVTIDGNVNGDGKADITIDANGASRVIDVAAGDVNLDSLTLTGGYVTTGGAGVYVAAGATATILDSTISGNVTNGSSNARGGGIRNEGTTTLVNSTVSGNYGSNAGGIFNPGGTLSLINTTVADNTSDIYVGGIYSFNGHLNIADSTITGNFGGPSLGGGIESFNDQGTLSNSIVAGNRNNSGVADIYSGGFSQQLAFAGVNVFSQSGVGGANDIHQADLSKIFADVTTVDPDSTPSHDFQAGALADNGGPVQTVAISPTGVAFNAGNSAVLPPDPNNPAEPLQVDARGEPRVTDGGLDVGAYQAQTPTNLVVTTLADVYTAGGSYAADKNSPDGLSLRDAIGLANAAGGSHTITFDPSLTGGTLTLTQGELDIASNITIDGGGTPDITISGGGASRVFEVSAGITTTLDGLIITDGATTGSGGGVELDGGGALTMMDSTLSDNTASQYGGAIENVSGASITLVNTTLSGNTAGLYGGGIDSVGGSITAINTTVSGNKATNINGGGIESIRSNFSLIDSTVSGNEAGNYGGGLRISGGALTLTNSIVAGNAAGLGNDISDLSATLTLLGNSILGSAPAGNSTFNKANGSYTQIDGTSAAALGTVFNQVGNDPNTGVLSGVLANNGGGIDTIALNPTGIAINAGNTADLPPDPNNPGEPLQVDARGFDRVTGGGLDLGAFQQQAPQTFIVTTLNDVLASTNPEATIADEEAGTGLLSLREALFLADEDPTVANTITFAANLAGGTINLAQNYGALDITNSVTIDGDIGGNGTPGITIDAGHYSQVFDVSAGTSTLDGLALTGGYSSNKGGGVYLASGAALTVTDSKLFGNSAETFGGGIDALGTLTLTNSTLSHNEAGLAGGGVYSDGTLAVVNSTLSGNNTYGGGGGIADNGGTLTLTNTTLSGNSAYNIGGAIGALNGALTLYDSTLTGNYASHSGGGVYNSGKNSTTLVNSIVAGNYAGTNESDLYGSAPLTLTGGNIVGDTLSVDGITSQTGIALNDIFASVTTNSYTGVSYAVPANNGGLVQTVALNPTGVAINAGNPADLPPDTYDLNNNGNTTEPLPVDARGFDRTAGGGLDLGAFQQQAPQTFVVTTLSDLAASTNPNPNDLSLREALFLANQGPTNADTITFASNLAGGTIDLTLGQLKIDGNVTIDGGNDNITIDAQNSSRVFDAVYGTSTINSLTISGGNALGYAAGDGGAIQVGSSKGYSGANLTISNSTIENSQAAYGGGIAVNVGNALQLTNDTISDNSAILVGGGIANQGTLTLTNSTVSNNSTGYIGGGIASDNTLTVIGSTLSGNQITGSGGIIPPGYSFGGGGGLYNSGSAALLNTTIAGNGGGSYSGGGIYNSRDLTLTNVTIADNSAYNGGGLSNAECGCGDVKVYDTTITGNDATQLGGGIYNAAGSVSLTNSIVAGNGAGYQDADIAGAGTTTYSGVNLFSQSGVGRAGTDIYVSPSDLSAVFAGLTTITPPSGSQFQAGTLANNGGSVQTVLITEGGLAQDTGDVAALPPDSDDLNNNGNTTEPLPVDARGDPRVVDGTVDIGAVELQTPPTPVVAAVSSNVNASASEIFTPSQLFSVSAPVGSPILSYEVEDETTGANQGFWVLNGAVLTNGQITTLTAAQLSALSFVAGSASTSISDTLEVAASDSVGLGAFTTFTVTAAAHAPTTPPTVTAANELQAPNQALAGSSLFSGTAFGGNSIVSYEVEDTTNDSGHWMFNGTVEPTNQVIDVTVAQLAQLSFDTGYGSDNLMVRANDGTQWGSFTSFTVTPPPNAAPPAGSTDTLLMLRNSDGAYEFYDIGHNAILLDGPLGAINPALQVAGVGGFNGSDTADLLMRDPTTGVFTLYDVSNNNITGNVVVGQVGLEWTVSGLGDFSTHAGETDMLMRNSNTGQFEVYDIANNAITFAGPMGQVGLEWSIAGFGDFAGNANETDMLMRNSNTGAFEVFDVVNNTITSAGPMGQVGLEWSIAGFGDFSTRANETDMLMRNSNTGAFEVFDIANNTITFAGPMGQVGLEWTIAGFGDFSGNANETDMLMRNSNTGVFELFDINNNTITPMTNQFGQVGLEWSISGVSATPASAPPTAQLTQAMASFAPSASTPAASAPIDQQMVAPTISTLLTTNHA